MCGYFRFSVKHVLLCGIWYSKAKPNMYTFLKPLVDTMNMLYKDGKIIMLNIIRYTAGYIMLYLCDVTHGIAGIEVQTPDGNKQCRAVILVSTLDLQARAIFCNMKAYNGQYSCCTCLDEGDNTIGAHAGIRYWPYNPSCQIRTLAGVNVAYRQATTEGVAVRF